MKFGTKTVHAGVNPDPTTGAIMTPIYQTSTYAQASLGDHKGYEYARSQNPTRRALEQSLAVLEGGKHGICFASGMAAIDAVIKLMKPGDEIICCNDLYGGTYRILTQVYIPLGIKPKFVNMADAASIEAHITPNTKMIWVETPTNPLMNIIDIQAVAEMADLYDCLLAVDNTFASPYLQNPLALGADIVVHSLTKYINGHSDVVMGAVILNDDELDKKIRFLQNSCGGVPGPQDSFLTLRGIKTLHLRMQRHAENGAKIAHFLNDHQAIERVYWPGLESHPNHEIAKKQMRDFGGMISFTLKDDRMETAIKFLNNTRLFSLAESLGGVESLINHPASMTHGSIPKEERLKIGLKDTLIRLSVGIEDADDLIEDLVQAINR